MFGAAGATPNPFAAAGGAPATPAPTPSLFGAPPAASGAQGATPSLFGAPPAAGQTPGQAQPALSLFGGAQPASSAAPFGAPTAGGLFSAPTTSAPPLGGSLFGAPTSTALTFGGGGGGGAAGFGAGAYGSGAGAFGGFGAASGGLAGGGGFGAAPGMGAQQPAAAAAPAPGTDIFPLFRAQMMAAWDPSNPRTCAFRHVLFDDASREAADGTLAPPPAEELQKLRSANRAAADDLLWDQADAHNPEPRRLVPTQLTGFQALVSRAEAQRAEVRTQTRRVSDLDAAVTELADRRDVDMRVKLDAYRARHVTLVHRLLGLMGKVEYLRARRAAHHHHAAAALGAPGGGGGGGGAGGAAAGTSTWTSELSLSELQLHNQFGALLEEVVHTKALRARLHSLHARMAQLPPAELPPAGTAELTADGVQHLAAVLMQQQAAITQLVRVIDTDARDLEIMRASLGGAADHAMADGAGGAAHQYAAYTR